jgi:cobalt-precorrin 5A hydrolase
MITLVSLTEAGARLAQRLQTQMPDAEWLHQPKPFAATVQGRFQAGHRLLMICATGIAVRTLAPVLQDKFQDPAVLVLDETGQFVIPLLSGHEGGANDWGREIAELIGSQLVITTANPYLAPVYTVGMGCERHCPESVLRELVETCLAERQLQPNQIKALASIDLKADEVGLIQLAQTLDWPFRTWPAQELRSVEHLLTQRSEIVFKEVGVYGVAEAAALVAAQTITGQPAELILPKHKNTRATCAIARSYIARNAQSPDVGNPNHG